MTTPTDINQAGWVGRLPASWIPFAQLARLDRPIGWWLLLLPSWWAILSAAIINGIPPLVTAKIMALFWIGAIAMRGAGCVINDLWDRDIDRAVARTQHRAMASGAVSPLAGFALLAMLGLIGLIILIQLPQSAIITGICAIPLIIIYPLAKRVTGLPQLVLSLTFGWGALLGFAAFGEWPTIISVILYAAVGCWIFGYDTIYAIQDIADDTAAGIKSSAITLGQQLKPVVAFSYGLTVLGLLLAGAMRSAEWAYYIGIAGVALHFKRQVSHIDLNDAMGAGDLFRSNRNVGLILTAALLAEFLL